MPAAVPHLIGKVSVFGSRWRSVPRPSGIYRYPDETTCCARGEYFRDPIRFARCTMRARASQSRVVRAARAGFRGAFPYVGAESTSSRAVPVHAYRPVCFSRGRAVRCSRKPVSNSRLRSRKITTNRKVSRYGSQFRTCRAQGKFCESAHAAARLEESGTPPWPTGERFREGFG